MTGNGHADAWRSLLRKSLFRASPSYSLRALDASGNDDPSLSEKLALDPSVFGLLVPSSTTVGGVRAVCSETAHLWQSMQTPMPLPDTCAENSAAETAIMKLVADGLLEIEHGGDFVSGPDALDLVDVSAPIGSAPTHALARLSIAALRYGARATLDDKAIRFARLYFYNRLPATARLKRRFPDFTSVANFLGLEHASIRTMLQDYSCPDEHTPQNAWLVYRHKRVSSSPAATPRFKLYVSPSLDDVPAAFERTVRACADSAAPGLKIGADIYGLLRPDKLVVYLSRWEELVQLAGQLQRSLAGLTAHGVPFTASLDTNGLLSWGMDPPDDPFRPLWQEKESWRTWVAARLNSALLVAEGHDINRQCRFALLRIQLEGVDTDNWCPSDFRSRASDLSALRQGEAN